VSWPLAAALGCGHSNAWGCLGATARMAMYKRCPIHAQRVVAPQARWCAIAVAACAPSHGVRVARSMAVAACAWRPCDGTPTAYRSHGKPACVCVRACAGVLCVASVRVCQLPTT
jgi:hypothetical protein